MSAAYAGQDFLWLNINLSAQIERIEPRLKWEMGPYHSPGNTLVISPGVRDNIELAIRVAAAAPALPGWHFLPAKPPKKLESLVMSLSGAANAEVCGDAWHYRLTGYNSLEFFDVEVFSDADHSISDVDLQRLTRHLIEAMLGESLYLKRIAAVKVYRRDEPRPPGKLTQFPLLGRHIAHVLKRQTDTDT